MKTQWSTSWISSKQIRKQRKFRYNAPLHVRRKFVSAHLSKSLRSRFNRRAVPLRKGDEVQVMRGEFTGVKGKVERVDLKKSKVFVENVKVKKVNGTEVMKALEPSNLLVTNLFLEDKMRKKFLEKKPPAKQSEQKIDVKKTSEEAK